MSSTELFRKHFGEESAAVGLKHPNMEAFFEELNQECLEEDKIKNCKHELVSREFINQPYVTCDVCGRIVFSQHDR